MSDRFYTTAPLKPGDVRLEGPEAHHLANVSRLQAGERVVLFNGDGHEYPAEIVAIGKKHVELQVVSVNQPNRELAGVAHIAAALPKGDRSDFLIEKLTELGATDFTPLLTARSIVRPKPTIVEKLQRAVIESSKQCRRNVLLRVHPPCVLEEWLQGAQLPANKWIAHPEGRRLTPNLVIDKGVAVAIGPEGGFTDEEIATAHKFGFEAIGLGPRILRIETAALAVMAWIGMANQES